MIEECTESHREARNFKNDSVESDCREKSVVNETADLYIVWNNSIMGDFEMLV